MHIICFLILVIFLFLSDFVFAEEKQPVELEPVVVTATKIEGPVSEIPASIEIVTDQDIKDRQVLTLDEALRTTPGLTVLSHGGTDPLSIISIRGTESYHSMIMIDGVKINTPYDQTPYAGALFLNNVKRIEVVKGSYSALYGSEAIGGIINVITSERPGLTYSLSGGTYRTSNGSLLYSNKYKETLYTLGYETLSTEGFKFSGPYWNNTLQGKISGPLSTTSSLKLSIYYWEWKKYDRNIGAEIKEFDFINMMPESLGIMIDEDSNVRGYNWLNSIQLKHSPLTWWDYNIKLDRYSTNFYMDNSLDTPTPDRPYPIEIDSDIKSFRDIFEMQHNFYYRDMDIVTFGFQYTGEEIEKEEFGNLYSIGLGPSLEQTPVEASRSSRAIYLQNLFKVRRSISLSMGARFENGPGFDSRLIPKASALYILPITRTRLNMAYDHGIRAPSLEELYHPAIGNSDLKPEESHSLEAGLEQPLMDDRIWLEATAFSIRLKNLINQDPSSLRMVNIDQSKIEGGEANLRWTITEKIHCDIGYTRLLTENIGTGEPLSFKPDYRWTFDIRYRPLNQLTLDLNAEIVGESFISLPPFPVTGLDGEPISDKVASHNVVNMAAAYNITKEDPTLGSLDLTLKLNNLFDEQYDEMPAFRHYGFTFLAGIRSLH